MDRNQDKSKACEVPASAGRIAAMTNSLRPRSEREHEDKEGREELESKLATIRRAKASEEKAKEKEKEKIDKLAKQEQDLEKKRLNLEKERLNLEKDLELKLKAINKMLDEEQEVAKKKGIAIDNYNTLSSSVADSENQETKIKKKISESLSELPQ